MVKVGINGFGRIGRDVLRAALGNPEIQIVAINDLTDSKTLAHLLKHDSLLGKLPAPVEAGHGALQVDGQRIVVFSERDPANIPWRDAGVDVVIEATGFFTEREKAAVHITHGGAKRVIISAPGKNDDLTVVMGVNHDRYDPAQHVVVSNGSCTTNGLAPAAQVLHQQFGIEHGLMNTTHAYTNSQALHDQPEKDLRGARAAALSIVPYSSGAAKALGKVIPSLDGKLTGYSLRVPVPVVSIVDLTVTLSRNVTAEEVNDAFRQAAISGPLKGILGYSDEPLVSRDYQGDPRSSIIDGLSTLVIGGNMVKILSWYDNEWGFSSYPLVAGHEVIGRVVALGSAAQDKGLKVGQRVGIGWTARSCGHCDACISGNQINCLEGATPTILNKGGFADKLRADWQWVIPLPDSIDIESAGPLLCGGITVFKPLLMHHITATSRVGVIGIGGLGHIAIKLLHAMGCEVTAFSSNPAKEQEVLAMGADKVVNSRDPQALTALAGQFDLIINTVNVDLDWQPYFEALAYGGNFHTVGAVMKPLPVPAFTLIGGDRSVSGSATGTPYELRKLMKFAGRSKVSPTTELYPMSQINEAIQHVRDGKARYRVVLKADF